MTDTSPPEYAKQHYAKLSQYLKTHLNNPPSQQRQSAREKLTKLYPHQFEELSTDVYDEMIRRQEDTASFLPVDSSFHPKRNQARQKLATLSVNRFKDLASDVYIELERRYPALVRKDDILQMVNFQSLDNLMGELGNMISSTGGGSDKDEAVVAGEGEGERDQKDNQGVSKSARLDNANVATPLDTTTTTTTTTTTDTATQNTINTLKLKLNQLETENKLLQRELAEKNPDRYIGQIKDLEVKLEVSESELERSRREMEGVRGEMESSRRECDATKHELESARNELESVRKELQSVVGDYEISKRELDSVRRELESVRGELESARRELDTTKKDLDSTKKDLDTTRKDLDTTRKELSATTTVRKSSSLRVSTGGRVSLIPNNNTTTTTTTPNNNTTTPGVVEDYSNIPAQIDITSPSLLSPQGLISSSDISQFKQSILELLKQGRNDTPAGVLLAMKSIVVATRSISEQIDNYQIDNQLRNDLSLHLTQLMTQAKNHATGVKDIEQLDRSAYDLTIDVLEIVKRVKIRSVPSDSQAQSNASSGQGRENSPNAKNTATPNASLPLGSNSSTKLYLEKQTDLIVQNIQLLLQSMRNNNNDLNPAIDNITTVVDELLRNMQQHQQTSNTLKQLEISNDKLRGMRSGSKQKVAAAAYEVAKYTKELVSLYDDVIQ